VDGEWIRGGEVDPAIGVREKGLKPEDRRNEAHPAIGKFNSRRASKSRALRSIQLPEANVLKVGTAAELETFGRL
jgi:hypothetical protein